jgi:hypothetical protein
LVLAVLVGAVGASLFWLYGPFMKGEVARQVGEAVSARPLKVEAGKGEAAKVSATQALGNRFQMVSDGKHTFLADLKAGRVWRYYQITRESGGREDEGFQPVAILSAGKRFYTAEEIEAALKAGEKQP